MPASKWKIAPKLSDIQFKIRHLMITNFSSSKICFKAEVDSISTNNE